MIRKKINNNNSSGDQIDFDYYLPEFLKKDLENYNQKNLEKNKQSLNGDYDDQHSNWQIKNDTKEKTTKKKIIPKLILKPKKILKSSSIILIGLIFVYFVINAPLYYHRFFHMRNVANHQQIITSTNIQIKENQIEKRVAPTSESRLIIPKIGVDAPIIFANSIIEEDIQEALREGVVHYFRTALPGENSNIFISGHSSNYWWEKGNYNFVFSLLDKMDIGDIATIYYKGYVYEYTVYEKFVVHPTDVSVLDQTKKPILTLMTCTPPGTDFRRLIVRLNQTFPIKNKTQKISENEDITKIETNKSSYLPRDKKNLIEYLADFISDILGLTN